MGTATGIGGTANSICEITRSASSIVTLMVSWDIKSSYHCTQHAAHLLHLFHCVAFIREHAWEHVAEQQQQQHQQQNNKRVVPIKRDITSFVVLCPPLVSLYSQTLSTTFIRIRCHGRFSLDKSMQSRVDPRAKEEEDTTNIQNYITLQLGDEKESGHRELESSDQNRRSRTRNRGSRRIFTVCPLQTCEHNIVCSCSVPCANDIPSGSFGQQEYWYPYTPVTRPECSRPEQAQHEVQQKKS